MPREKSAGALIFRIAQGKPYYLLLHYPSSSKAKEEYWDLPKGHMEEGETEQTTVKREMAEETGLQDVELVDGFRETIHYWFKFQGKTISKTVVFYLAKADQEEITISSEHTGYQWLAYADALKKLTFQNAKDILQKAHEFLQKHDSV